jgi:phospholipid transport system substrate-binding protein
VLAAAVAGFALLAATTPVYAGPATDRLREFFTTINVILTDPATQSQPLERVARVKHLVTDIADVRGAAAAALDREWDARTPSERDEFTRLFGELLERGLVARLAGTVSPVNGMVMSWRGETRVGDEARVMTIVEARDGRKMNVEYRMAERRGHWLVRDVVVDGVSTIENYRSQFKRLLRQGSYTELVKQLRAKLREETLMFAQTPPSALQPPTKSEPVISRPSALGATRSTAPAAPTTTHARDAAHAIAARPAEPAHGKSATPVDGTATPAPVAKSTTTAKAKSTPVVVAKSTPAVVVKSTPSVAAKPTAAATVKSTASAVAKSTTVVKSTPAVATKPSPAVVKSTEPSLASTPRLATEVATTPNRPRAKKASMNPPAPLAADVTSPVGVLEATAHLLPSILLVMLGFGGVSGVVFLRRRASAEALVLQRLRNSDKRLVLVHPVTRVPKVGERRRKRRVVPAPRNPARHVDDAHGA